MMEYLAGHHIKNLRRSLNNGAYHPVIRNPDKTYTISAGIADIVCKECGGQNSCFAEGVIGNWERWIYDVFLAHASGFAAGDKYKGYELLKKISRQPFFYTRQLFAITKAGILLDKLDAELKSLTPLERKIPQSFVKLYIKDFYFEPEHK